jgi:hypothetical protein
MTILDDTYPEVRDLHSLYRRMGRRLPDSLFAWHCRTAAISMYGLFGSANGALSTASGARVHLRVMVNGRLWPQQGGWRWRPVPRGKTLVVLEWSTGEGLVELVNGSRSGPDEAKVRRVRGQLDPQRDAQAEPIEVLAANAPRDYLEAGDGGDGRGQGPNGPGGPGDPNAPDGPDGPDEAGGGGLVEVLSHPVLFSTDPDYYRSLLGNY